MRDKRIHRFAIALAFFLLAGADVSCEKSVSGIVESGFDPSIEETGNAAGADEVTRNLLCLKDGDTESLAGVSFGDAFNYDKYVSTGTWCGRLENSRSDISQAPQHKEKYGQSHRA